MSFGAGLRVWSSFLSLGSKTAQCSYYSETVDGYPDPREDPTTRSLHGGFLKVPIAV